MEFLVQIQVTVPPQMPAEELARLMEAEHRRGTELREAGTVVRIWRVPGRTANAAIWNAPDATALHSAISSLPMFPFMQADVTPLATHPLEA
jgi:muconolactone D-isomerase